MKTRLIAASILSLGLLSAGAFAGQAGDEVNNHIADYGRPEVLAPNSTKALAADAIVVKKRKHVSIGDFIDETAEEKNQRSSK